jgi:hypothetical protein
MTFRKLFVRLKALPSDSWLHSEVRMRAAEEQAEDAGREQVQEIDDAIARIRRHSAQSKPAEQQPDKQPDQPGEV